MHGGWVPAARATTAATAWSPPRTCTAPAAGAGHAARRSRGACRRRRQALAARSRPACRRSRTAPREPDLVIDALLGLGASRAPQGAIARPSPPSTPARAGARDRPALRPARRHRARLGAAAVRATHTLALLTLKPGLFTAEGRDHAGDVWLDDLGVRAARRATPPGRVRDAPDAPGAARRMRSTRAASATSSWSAARQAWPAPPAGGARRPGRRCRPGLLSCWTAAQPATAAAGTDAAPAVVARRAGDAGAQHRGLRLRRRRGRAEALPTCCARPACCSTPMP